MLEMKKIFEQFLMRYEQAPYNKDTLHIFTLFQQKRKLYDIRVR